MEALSNSPSDGTIPEIGFVRLPQVLGVFPISKSSWWKGVKAGKYPKPVKLSANVTAWRAEDIRKLISQLEAQKPANN